MNPAEVIQWANLALTLTESIGTAVDAMHKSGEISDEQLLEIKGRYDAVGASWDERVKAAKARAGG